MQQGIFQPRGEFLRGGPAGLQPAAVQESSMGSGLPTIYGVRQLTAGHLCISTAETWLELDLDRIIFGVGCVHIVQIRPLAVVVLPISQELSQMPL